MSPPGRAAPPASLRPAARVVMLYALFASLWILFSDFIVGALFDASGGMQEINTLKGLAFVMVTSAWLFILLARLTRGNGLLARLAGDVPGAEKRALLGGIVLLSVVFILLGLGGMRQSLQQHKVQEAAQLRSIAHLNVARIEAWMAERVRDAQVLRSAALFMNGLPLWLRDRDPALKAELLVRLEEFRATLGYEAIAVYDAEATPILYAGDLAHAHPGDEAQLETLRRALASGTVGMTELYCVRDAVRPHVHLDVVAPVALNSGPAGLAIVLHIDVEASLYAMLRDWPLPDQSGEVVLFRRDGDTLLVLNDLRHHPGSALSLSSPLSRTDRMGAAALAPGYRPGELLEGLDYRDRPTLGAALPVGGRDWWLVAKIDRAEALSEAYRSALWIGFSALLTWLASIALALLLYQRHVLARLEGQRQAQADRLRALGLLEAIAESSADAIYAKDSHGRYILFNRAASQLGGIAREDALGHDDRALLPAARAEAVMARDRRVMAAGGVTEYEERIETPDGTRTLLVIDGPLRDADGRVIGLYGIARDISERVRMEEALRQGHAELERFNRAMVGRELDMLRLKGEVNRLAQALGQVNPYPMAEAALAELEAARPDADTARGVS